MLFGKMLENIEKEKLLQIVCFQSQSLEFSYISHVVTTLHFFHHQQ